MAYSVEADITNQIPNRDLIELTDDSDPPVAVITAVLDEMIEKADNQINSYMRGKQSPLPLSPVPPRVKDWSVTLAIFNLYKRRIDLEIPEAIRVDHDDVMTELRAVRDGKLLIDDAASPANTASFYKSNGSQKTEHFDSNLAGSGNLDQFYNGPC